MNFEEQKRERRVGVGLDFGTSNSAIALFDGSAVTLLTFASSEEQFDHIPTALCIDRRHHQKIGYEAIAVYLRENAGRVVTLRKEELGQHTVTINRGGDAVTAKVTTHAFTDRDLPCRLLRGLKRWLGFKEMHHINVFDKPYSLIALLEPIIGYLGKRMGDLAGSGGRSVHVGRPVLFEGCDAEQNRIGMARLNEACKRSGLKECSLFPEPIAAILSYLQGAETPEGEHFLCFDFGGGTLDLCVVQTEKDGCRVLSTCGIDLGGDEIDQQIYVNKVFPELGDGVQIKLGTRTVSFPFHDVSEGLLSWQMAYNLNQPHIRERILKGIQQGGEAAVKLTRLRELIRKNQSYLVFRAIEKAKIELSSSMETMIHVPEIGLEIPFTRAEFEAILVPSLEKIAQGLAAVMADAGLNPEQVRAAVCTGGSSQIPAVRREIEKVFPGKLVEHGTFTSIAAGLAIANYRGLTFDQA